MELYSRQDLQENAGQLRRVLAWLGLLSLVFAAALGATLWARVYWLTVLTTLIWGGLLIFLWEMKVSPVLAYRRYLRELFAGLRRRAEGKVVSFSPEGTYKEGGFFSALIINSDSKMDAEGERLFYVDRCKTRPALEPGDFVRVTAYGNFMTAWEK
jgi:hypothetical protein